LSARDDPRHQVGIELGFGSRAEHLRSRRFLRFHLGVMLSRSHHGNRSNGRTRNLAFSETTSAQVLSGQRKVAARAQITQRRHAAFSVRANQ